MANETENLVLEHLRHIRATVEVIAAEIRRNNTRVSTLEHGHANLMLSDAEQNAEIERKERLERSEKRLALRD